MNIFNTLKYNQDVLFVPASHVQVALGKKLGAGSQVLTPWLYLLIMLMAVRLASLQLRGRLLGNTFKSLAKEAVT